MSRFKLTGMEKVRTWIEDSPPPIFGPDRDDVLAALERIQAQLEAAQAVVEAARRVRDETKFVRGEAQLNVELWAEVVDALMALDGPHSSRVENQAEAERDAAVEALRDAATVIERMANGASRAECSPEFDRLVAVLSGQEKKQPAS